MTGEAILVSYLNGVGFQAFGGVPESRPGEFVTVERTGGRRTRVIDSGTYAVQVWAGSTAEAMTLANRVADLLVDAPRVVDAVASVDVVSVYNFPDPDSRQARYQLTVSAAIMHALD